MDWDRVNIWTNTLYTLIHSLQLAKSTNFGDLETLHEHIINAEEWTPKECSYNSVLLDEPFGRMRIRFRRDPNKYFPLISEQLVKMLIQDLTVIFDDMMAESLRERQINVPIFPQSKIERLSTFLDRGQYTWALHGCLELVAIRNILTHSSSRWNEKTLLIVKNFVTPLPKVGDKLVIGIPMLFRYRKAMRTFLNETKP